MTPSGRFPGITWPIARDEIEREIAYRRRTYPERIAQGRMTKTEADWQIELFTAIEADVGRMAAPYAPPAHEHSWNDRRAALWREIELRERFYPNWIADGRLTQERADHQLGALRAVQWRFDGGFDWRPSNGTWDQTAQDMLDGKPRTPAQEETWAEMDAIWRPGTGFFYQRWPNANTPAAEPELAL
jgi:hypothetical protein